MSQGQTGIRELLPFIIAALAPILTVLVTYIRNRQDGSKVGQEHQLAGDQFAWTQLKELVTIMAAQLDDCQDELARERAKNNPGLPPGKDDKNVATLDDGAAEH